MQGANGKQFATILIALVAPRSRGTVKITSKDTTILPTIDPAWLTSSVDQVVAVEAFKRTRAVFQAKAMPPVLNGPESYPGNATQSDSDILDFSSRITS